MCCTEPQPQGTAGNPATATARHLQLCALALPFQAMSTGLTVPRFSMLFPHVVNLEATTAARSLGETLLASGAEAGVPYLEFSVALALVLVLLVMVCGDVLRARAKVTKRVLPNVWCAWKGMVVQAVTHTKRRQHSFQVIIRITSLLQLGLQLLNNGLQLRLFLPLKRNQFGLHPLNLFLHLLHGLPSKQ